MAIWWEGHRIVLCSRTLTGSTDITKRVIIHTFSQLVQELLGPEEEGPLLGDQGLVRRYYLYIYFFVMSIELQTCIGACRRCYPCPYLGMLPYWLLHNSCDAGMPQPIAKPVSNDR